MCCLRLKHTAKDSYLRDAAHGAQRAPYWHGLSGCCCARNRQRCLCCVVRQELCKAAHVVNAEGVPAPRGMLGLDADSYMMWT